ncbi:MAG: DUF4358 domain-containing protein [Clostridia bacterium]|nr:DUF4358 domain-containing protein [Clostridia bacterium]
MKKVLALILAAVLVLSFAACTKNSDNKPSNNKTDVTLTPEEIEKKIADAVGKDNYLCDTDIDKDMLKNVYQLDLSQVESYVAKQNSIASVNPDTVIVLKVKDGYADSAVKALNEGFGQIVDYIRQYPFGTAKVLGGKIYKVGNYVIYIIAGKSYEGENSEEESKLAASEYEKIEAVMKDIFGNVPENLAVVPKDDENEKGFDFSDDSKENSDTPLLGG